MPRGTRGRTAAGLRSCVQPATDRRACPGRPRPQARGGRGDRGRHRVPCDSDPGWAGAADAAVSSEEEDDMSETTPALDEAFERMAAASFELPNGFVNHGAMACEALAVLGCAGDIDSWARRFARAGACRTRGAVRRGRTGGRAPPGEPARRCAGRGGRAQPGPAPGQARRGLPARARGHRRSGLRGCRRNGHRPALTDAPAARTGALGHRRADRHRGTPGLRSR
jgi:hypothetical protein